MGRVEQVTIITGGSRGIGAATARRLAEDGHHIAIGYRRDETAANRVVADVTDAGTRCVAVRVDTAVDEDVESLFATAAAELGPITALVNNAGTTSPMGRLAELRPDDIRRVIDVRHRRVALRRMAARTLTRGGAIVNLSSAAATRQPG